MRTHAGVELSLVVDGTAELLSWVPSFGDKAVVLEPETLRVQVAKLAEGMLLRYAQPASRGAISQGRL